MEGDVLDVLLVHKWSLPEGKLRGKEEGGALSTVNNKETFFVQEKVEIKVSMCLIERNPLIPNSLVPEPRQKVNVL